MSDTLSHRLRAWPTDYTSPHDDALMREAADTIERQAAELAEARQDFARLMHKHNALHANCAEHRAELAALRAQVEALKSIGERLSNVAFNWAQEANGTGSKLDDGERSMLKVLQRQWDAAMSASGGEIQS